MRYGAGASVASLGVLHLAVISTYSEVQKHLNPVHFGFYGSFITLVTGDQHNLQSLPSMPLPLPREQGETECLNTLVMTWSFCQQPPFQSHVGAQHCQSSGYKAHCLPFWPSDTSTFSVMTQALHLSFPLSDTPPHCHHLLLVFQVSC